MHRVALHWLRRDLRLADNPALTYACEHAEHVVLCYVHATDEETPWQPGAASRWWLHHSLIALDRDLRAHKQSLVIRTASSLEGLLALSKETNATLVTWNRLYDPAIVARDTTIKAELESTGIEVHTANAALFFEPWQIQTQQSQPYKVFTPYWRACTARLESLPPPLPAPKQIRAAKQTIASQSLEQLELLPTIEWDKGLRATWQPGEAGAQLRLRSFIDSHLVQYRDGRDYPERDSTSHLSPHLHFGEISPRQIYAALRTEDGVIAIESRDAFVRELGWREFAHHVLFHFPHTADRPFDPRFEQFPWVANAAALRAWERGATGIPIIDAGMRELWQTGYMHNRVRMLVASLLTKNLGIHWLDGARWFWDTLVDADLANNSLGWQWTAGCGTDAAPFFRIFNPVTQGERFDAAGVYVRRFVPELARLPDKWIHQPFNAPKEVLSAAGIELGIHYPLPVVDLRATRATALESYQSLRSDLRVTPSRHLR